MNQLTDFSDTRFNPPERKVRSYSDRTLELMVSDMMDRLLANGNLLSSCIYDGDDNSLNCAEANRIGDILASIMTCKLSDRSDHIEDLRSLFERPLKCRAEQMAVAYLESPEDD